MTAWVSTLTTIAGNWMSSRPPSQRDSHGHASSRRRKASLNTVTDSSPGGSSARSRPQRAGSRAIPSDRFSSGASAGKISAPGGGQRDCYRKGEPPEWAITLHFTTAWMEDSTRNGNISGALLTHRIILHLPAFTPEARVRDTRRRAGPSAGRPVRRRRTVRRADSVADSRVVPRVNRPNRCRESSPSDEFFLYWHRYVPASWMRSEIGGLV